MYVDHKPAPIWAHDPIGLSCQASEQTTLKDCNGKGSVVAHSFRAELRTTDLGTQ